MFFSKTYQSSLTLKGGSTSHLGLLPSGKKRKPPYSVLKPLRYKVGGPSEVYASSGAAVFCAGMNPLSLKDLLRGCLLVAFFENLPVLLLLIKLAALGNLKVNFHCAHWHSFFPLKKGLSKTHQSSLTLKGGSTAHPGLLQ